MVTAALLFLAFNMRTAIAAVSPVLPEIRASDNLSAPVAGLLTTLPLLCFGSLSPLVPRMVRRTGPGRLLLFAIAGVTLGITVRSLPPVSTLFVGTFILGCSLAVMNVLMPGVVKSRFARYAGLATGSYTATIDVGLAISAAVTVPLTHAFGGSWRLAIGIWAVLALVAVGIWWRFRDLELPDQEGIPDPAEVPGVWRSPTAWWITSYWGLQSLNFFTVLAWLPTVLRARGLTAAGAGATLSLVGLVAIPAALIAPLLAHRVHGLRIAITLSSLAIAGGVLGLLTVSHGLETLWAVLLGIGQGSSLSLVLVLIVVRAGDSAHAIAMSGMAQGIGYLVAATGPALIGAVEAATNGWSAPLALLFALSVALGICGWVAATA